MKNDSTQTLQTVTMHKQSKEISGLYVLKAICAYFVVAIHFSSFVYDYSFLIVTVRAAVPCFFLITGYFLYSNERCIEIKKIFSWIKKIAILIFLLNSFYYIYDHSKLPTIESILQSFVHGYEHLWYLTSLLHGLFIYLLLRICFSDKIICIFPLLVYALLVADQLNQVIVPMPLNGLFVALVYIGLGYAISKYKHKLKNRIFYCVLYAISIAFYYIFYKIDQSCFLLLILALFVNISFFCSFLKSDFSAKNPLVYIGKMHASNIYYFHMFVPHIMGFTLFHLLNYKYYPDYAAPLYIGCIIFSCVLLYSKCFVLFLYKKIQKCFKV